MPATEIIPRLWLGSFEDMVKWAERRRQHYPPPAQSIICVLEDSVLESFERKMLPDYTIFSAVLDDNKGFDERAPEERLDKATMIIENELAKPSNHVLVSCGAGIERSPLTIAWFLYRKRGMTLDSAYQLIKKLRPQIMDRQSWIQYSVYQHG